jgi:hypothetical protein
LPRLGAIATDLEILLHAHIHEQPPAFRDDRNTAAAARARTGRGDIFAIEAQHAAANGQEPRERVGERGLAGTVGPDHGDQLAVADGERHVPQRRRIAVSDLDGIGLKHALPSRDRR